MMAYCVSLIVLGELRDEFQMLRNRRSTR
jgi:hypothetical protein